MLRVDAFSKKIWTQLMNTDTTTSKTLAVLYGWFCSETGTPTTLVSDNGPQFTANDFKDKMKLGELSMFSHHLIIPVQMEPQNVVFSYIKIGSIR